MKEYTVKLVNNEYITVEAKDMRDLITRLKDGEITENQGINYQNVLHFKLKSSSPLTPPTPLETKPKK